MTLFPLPRIKKTPERYKDAASAAMPMTYSIQGAQTVEDHPREAERRLTLYQDLPLERTIRYEWPVFQAGTCNPSFKIPID